MTRPKLLKGPKIFRDIVEEICKYIDINRPISGIGSQVYAAPGGRPVNVTGTHGGASANIIQPFELLSQFSSGDPPQPEIRVIYSTLAGEAPDGFSPGDDPPYILTPVGSEGYVYGVITIDGTTGDITSRALGIDATIPDDGDTTFYVEIGSYSITDGALTVVNARYGPIDVQICRKWFANSAPYWDVTFL